MPRRNPAVASLFAAPRPRPPAGFAAAAPAFAPAPEMAAWLRATFVDADGPLANPEHAHLVLARLGCLWTNVACSRRGRRVAARAERPLPRGSDWGAARSEFQTRAWFDGTLPDFLITFDAGIVEDLSDAALCSLCEHELYHLQIAVDPYGQPCFRSDGLPLWTLRGHDVEEFVGVVRRYGARAAAPGAAALAEAASRPPEIAEARVQAACGTCSRLVA